MSVYIKGMEMPTDCAMLLKIFPDGRVGVPVHLNWMGTLVVNDAEAVPVPPHGRLIDIDAPYQIQVHVDGLTKKGSVDIYAPAVLEADPAEEGE